MAFRNRGCLLSNKLFIVLGGIIYVGRNPQNAFIASDKVVATEEGAICIEPVGAVGVSGSRSY